MSDTPIPNETPKPVSTQANTPAESTQNQNVPPAPSSSPTPKPTPAIATKQSTEIIAKPITRMAEQLSGESMDRRTFLKWLTIGWSAFAAVMAGYGTLFMRYMFPNVLFEPPQSFRAGYPDEYQIGEVSERWKDKYGVWIVRDSEKIYALSTTCTHLGCTPNWLLNENKFKCPCHGSGFYKTGINFEGPAPRPLERFKIILSEDGEIVVDKTKKFQQEKGEWSDSESYLTV